MTPPPRDGDEPFDPYAETLPRKTVSRPAPPPDRPRPLAKPSTPTKRPLKPYKPSY